MNWFHGWRALKGTGRVVSTVDVFTALTGDVICEYGFDRPYGMVDSPDIARERHHIMMDGESVDEYTEFGKELMERRAQTLSQFQANQGARADDERASEVVSQIERAAAQRYQHIILADQYRRCSSKLRGFDRT